MKLIKKITVALMCVFMFALLACITISADESALWSQETLVNQKKNVNTVSYGLDVIAKQNEMAIAGMEGNVLNFSRERFACAMNLSKVDCITITKLPDESFGALYIGSEGVSSGQKISGSNIDLMTYEETQPGIGKNNSFSFTINDMTYEIVCNLHMIDKINYSPTLSLASYASLNTETYKNVAISSVLSAYDPEDDGIKFEITSYPQNGRVVITDRTLGTYTYIPNTDYTGKDSFEYVVSDVYGNYSASAEVNLDIKNAGTSTVYSDLLYNDELQSHAISMTECGLMNGVQIGENYYFESGREVTRAEFLITAMNAIGIRNVPSADVTVFADDAEIYPEMKGYISLAYSKGYISGIKSSGKLYFRPEEAITLSEAAVIVSNIIGYAEPKVTPVFADADNIPSWSGKAIESLHTLGILEFPDKVTGACENVTRGDMAKILNKTMFVINQ